MKKYLAITIYVLIGILIVSLFFMFRNTGVSDILSYTPESPFLAALAFLGLFCIKAVVIVIPLMALFISAGMIFPIGWALVICFIGLFLEMTIGYFIGRRLSFDKAIALASRYKRLESILPGKRSMPLPVAFFLRLTPFSFDIISIIKSAYGIKYPKFILITYLGASLSLIPYLYIGRYITTPLTVEFILPVIILAIIMSLPFIANKIRQQNYEAKLYESDNN